MNKLASITLLCVCAISLASSKPPTNVETSVHNEQIQFSVNGFIDTLLAQIRKMLVRRGYDPMALPDYETSFLHLGLLGKLQLSHCQLYNISTMYRSQDVNYHSIDGGIQVQTALSFTDVKVNCTYTASLLTIITTSVLTKTGEVVVSFPNMTAELDMDIKRKGFITPDVHVNSVHLSHNGLIDVHLEGGLIDVLVSLLTEVISNLFKDVILYEVEGEITDKINEILQEEMPSLLVRNLKKIIGQAAIEEKSRRASNSVTKNQY